VAVTHLDRVRKGLDLLAVGLGPYVDRDMTQAAPTGTDWLDLLKARDDQRNGRAAAVSKDGPALLLRRLTEEWRAFGGSLSRLDQSCASELRDIRNKAAHQAPFSADDTYRALDTMERLRTDVGAVGQADLVNGLGPAGPAERRHRRASRSLTAVAAA